jgi:hypothetical protein
MLKRQKCVYKFIPFFIFGGENNSPEKIIKLLNFLDPTRITRSWTVHIYMYVFYRFKCFFSSCIQCKLAHYFFFIYKVQWCKIEYAFLRLFGPNVTWNTPFCLKDIYNGLAWRDNLHGIERTIKLSKCHALISNLLSGRTRWLSLVQLMIFNHKQNGKRSILANDLICIWSFLAWKLMSGVSWQSTILC